MTRLLLPSALLAGVSTLGGAFQLSPAPRRLRTAPSSCQLRMGLLDVFQTSTPDGTKQSRRSSSSGGRMDEGLTLEIGEEIGRGTYGTVHMCRLLSDDGDDGDTTAACIAKRAWTTADLEAIAQDQAATSNESNVDKDALKDKAERCVHYLGVERHCLEKLADNAEEQEGDGSQDGDEGEQHVPAYRGTYADADGREWIVVDVVPRVLSSADPAPALSSILEEDWTLQHRQDEADERAEHHLYVLQKALGMAEDATFGDVLDAALVELLKAVVEVNGANIVHRDVKPGNLLVREGGFTLIDFGSAADLDPPANSASAAFSSVLGGSGGRIGLEDGGVVALSPIYAAPETFVRWDRAPLNFDSFSAALVFAQMLFNLLDERAEAATRQQLEDCDFNLDAWLQRELAAEMQPDGIEDAVVYLSERPGLWAVLRDMLHPDPERRASTSAALKRVEAILQEVDVGVVDAVKADGKFFAEVLATFELCELPDAGMVVGAEFEAEPTELSSSAFASPAESTLTLPRPLHYVATFSRAQSLGLLLAEVDPDGEYDDELSEEDAAAWEEATANARPGEIYIRGVVEGGQADAIGIFEVGDRLEGVGEFPFQANGFDTVVEMLEAQPVLSKTVTLHFARRSTSRSHAYERTAPHLAKVVGQGAWSAKGRRKTQEDRFILHEWHDGDNAALLAGVFDGHGGDAASTTLAQLMPSLFSVELSDTLSTNGRAESPDFRKAMESAYELTCSTYQNDCANDEGLCTADYDPIEGIVMGSTSAADVIAGSTVTMASLGVSEEGADIILTVLNCGDSRTLAFGRPRGGTQKDSVVHFSTRDHSPSCEIEMDRLALGKDMGYSQPNCSMGRWRIKVGDYQYALARSLEGSFATSKGIVSEPDILIVNVSNMIAERELCSIVLASDGLFEVIDNEEAGRDVLAWREAGQTAEEVAKQLCREAVEKGSPDNVSVVVIYLD